MTSEQSGRLHAAAEAVVDSVWLRGAGRFGMIIITLLSPFIYQVISRTYDSIAALQRVQADQSTLIQLLSRDATNDRANMHQLDDAAQRRIDLTFQRINMAPTKAETDKDFQLRDQRIDALDKRIDVVDKRVGGLESRMNGPAAH